MKRIRRISGVIQDEHVTADAEEDEPWNSPSTGYCTQTEVSSSTEGADIDSGGNNSY